MAEPDVPVNDVIIDYRELFKFHSYSSKKVLRRQIDRVTSSCNTVVKQENDKNSLKAYFIYQKNGCLKV